MQTEEFVRSLLRDQVDQVMLSSVQGRLICEATVSEPRNRLHNVQLLPELAKAMNRRLPALNFGALKAAVLQAASGNVVQMLFGPLVLTFVLAADDEAAIGAVLAMRADLDGPMSQLVEAYN
ncbi:hypothetical protein PTSG_08551 [Salpingoeca rosetta]|uniref:Roadblock/LAMTOR2 domain-containing protein n=1 Tax=Salpingoeca rosetta (strain ATCC 50818 / BSB-021) TaxID=946362 RepID=F2UK07_SALR5|nr:uncharacterized protein PTSG_08551 [Salpingoeca rosetta]EGD77456.1 hypothetical protein PTSG_08551 [Salpingoeca rosetta]|eukprot:XP_004990344.1 hypothetical protein PTSG_08551 [Salpingoeca rosetta]